jgi:hypothetical protein
LIAISFRAVIAMDPAAPPRPEPEPPVVVIVPWRSTDAALSIVTGPPAAPSAPDVSIDPVSWIEPVVVRSVTAPPWVVTVPVTRRSPPVTVIDPDPTTVWERIVVPLKRWSPVSSVMVFAGVDIARGAGEGSPVTRKAWPLRTVKLPPSPPAPVGSALPPERLKPGDVRSADPLGEKDPAGAPLSPPPQPERATRSTPHRAAAVQLLTVPDLFRLP